MGLCFSKKKEAACPRSNGGVDREFLAADKKAEASKNGAKEGAGKEANVVEKKPVIAEGEKKKDCSLGTKEGKLVQETAAEVLAAATPVRASSCSKEEVDAILIQCGRLSRSSSGNAVAASGGSGGGHHRRYSGSKRSFDFDNEKSCHPDDEEYEKNVAGSRPSPRRRSRERSGSGTGNGVGSRRVSRSPGRRSDNAVAAAAAAGEKGKAQPGKMVSVPATEKENPSARRTASSATASGKRSASPRSHSPARMAASVENAVNGPTPSLSRSSSKRAEQSPLRRTPMTEIDDNTARAGSHKNQSSNQAPSKKSVEMGAATNKSESKGASNTVTTNIVSGGRSSRRSSRDFDHVALAGDNAAVAPSSYASLLEDIQNYHQQHGSSGLGGPAPALSLPACVAKACSILDAVADLNSSSSENKSNATAEVGRYDALRRSVVVESEIVVKDDLMEPSLHKYVSVRDIRDGEDTEPQESAGSNSFVASSQWMCPWDPSSVGSADQFTAQSNSNIEELEPEDGGASPVVRPRQRALHKAAVTASPGGGIGRSRASGNKAATEHVRQVHRSGGGRLGVGRMSTTPTAAAST